MGTWGITPPPPHTLEIAGKLSEVSHAAREEFTVLSVTFLLHQRQGSYTNSKHIFKRTGGCAIGYQFLTSLNIIKL